MRRIALTAFTLAALIPAAAFPQQAYPVRPVRLIVPYPPGGAVDAVARITGLKLSGKLTCAISSRGAAGHLATEMLKFGAGLDFLIVPYEPHGEAA